MTQKYRSPYTASRRWLRGNLHLHTCCGPYMDPAESGPLYARLGYQFLAVTDHDKTPEATVWPRWCREASVTLLPGVERSVPEHILCIGIEALPEVVTGDYGASARLLRATGAFTIGAHPQEYAEGAQRLREGAPALHAMELFNGLRAKRGCHEPANVVLWDELLTAGERLWGVATDDFHRIYIDPGHGWVAVQAPAGNAPLGWPALVELLKQGAFYASTGPAFEALLWDGRELRAIADPATERITVIGPGGEPLAEAAGASLTWTPPPGLRYFRVEAAAGDRRAWSQPFFGSAEQA